MPDGSISELGWSSQAQALTRLPDQLTVKFGPTDAIARFVLSTDRKVREEAGIRLSLSNDFTELAAVNEANRRSWYNLVPWIDPTYGDLPPDQQFWVRGVNHAGETVLAHAVRLFVCQTSLKEEVESLRMVYPDVARRADATAKAVVTAPCASGIAGRISWSGGLWFREDYRGKGLARVIPRLSRAIALTNWLPDCHVTYVTKEKAEKGITTVYGYDGYEEGISLYNMQGFPSPFELVVCFKRPDDVLAELDQSERAYKAAREMTVAAERPALVN